MIFEYCLVMCAAGEAGVGSNPKNPKQTLNNPKTPGEAGVGSNPKNLKQTLNNPKTLNKRP